MNHRLWEAYDTRANHDVPRFSAALDFSISILDISGHVTCTLVVLLSNVRETLHSMRADELSGLLSLSLSLSMCFSQDLSVLPQTLPPFLQQTRGKQGGTTRHGTPWCACQMRVQRRSRTVVDRPRCRPISLLGFVLIGCLPSMSIKSLSDSIPWKPEFECRITSLKAMFLRR